MQSFSTRGLKALFSYPVRKAGWEKKLILLAAFTIAGLVIPIIPWLFASGYFAEMIRRAAREDDPELPEWNSWNDFLMDGLRVMGVSLIYLLPLIVLFGLGFGSYFASFFGMTAAGEGDPSPFFFLSLGAGFTMLMCSMVCGLLFSMVFGVIMPAGLTHVVVKRSFAAFFQFGAWWRIFRANLGGYVIYLVLLGGMTFIWQMLYSILASTFVLLPLAFLAPFLIAPYFSVVVALMMGRVYREAEENLALAVEPADAAPPAPIQDVVI